MILRKKDLRNPFFLSKTIELKVQENSRIIAASEERKGTDAANCFYRDKSTYSKLAVASAFTFKMSNLQLHGNPRKQRHLS